MKISTTQSFENSIVRYSRESMRELRPNIEKFTGELEQFPQDHSGPVLVIIAKGREGRSFSSAYSDTRFYELVDVHAIFEYETKGRKRLLDRKWKAAERAKAKADAQAAIEAERARKRKLIKHIQQEQKEFMPFQILRQYGS